MRKNQAKTSIDVTEEVRTRVYERDNYTCVYCKHPNLMRPTKDNQDYKFCEIGHYRTKGATNLNIEENLVTICNVCHGLQHQDLLKGKQIRDAMGRYLKKLYPKFYQ